MKIHSILAAIFILPVSLKAEISKKEFSAWSPIAALGGGALSAAGITNRFGMKDVQSAKVEAILNVPMVQNKTSWIVTPDLGSYFVGQLHHHFENAKTGGAQEIKLETHISIPSPHKWKFGHWKTNLESPGKSAEFARQWLLNEWIPPYAATTHVSEYKYEVKVLSLSAPRTVPRLWNKAAFYLGAPAAAWGIVSMGQWALPQVSAWMKGPDVPTDDRERLFTQLNILFKIARAGVTSSGYQNKDLDIRYYRMTYKQNDCSLSRLEKSVWSSDLSKEGTLRKILFMDNGLIVSLDNENLSQIKNVFMSGMQKAAALYPDGQEFKQLASQAWRMRILYKNYYGDEYELPFLSDAEYRALSFRGN